MTIIRVDPSILQGESGNIDQAGQHVDRSGANVERSARGAPSYDGQFGPKVWGIGGEARARASQLNGQLDGLAGRLGGKARAFEQADLAGQKGLGWASWKIWDDWLDGGGGSISKMPAWWKDLDPALLLYLGLLITGNLTLLVMTFISYQDFIDWVAKTFPNIRLPWRQNPDAGKDSGDVPDTTSPNSDDRSQEQSTDKEENKEAETSDTDNRSKERSGIVALKIDSDTSDCVRFVDDQRDVPSGFNQDDFYSGRYKGKEGTLPDDGPDYGQEPRLGAIMVESPGPAIKYGHASYVFSVTRDETGKVVEYTVAEGNWNGDKTHVHYEPFIYDETSKSYIRKDGMRYKRSPDMFIY